MRFEFRSKLRDGNRWRAFVERLLRGAFRRLGAFVARIRVELDEAVGPRPQFDKRARAVIELRDGRVAQADASARSFREAVDQATQRARQAVLQHLHRVELAQAQPVPQPARLPAPRALLRRLSR